MSLNLYAKIEPYIGFYDDYEKLYNHYIKLLKKYKINNILDVGCGNGRMLEILSEKGYKAKGIDLSEEMVQIARQKGVDATCQNISEIKDKYDAVVCIADVLNYMDIKSLKIFLENIKNVLKKGGIFICDINTLHGFRDIADGAMINESDKNFLSIDAVFDGKKLDTNITFFEKENELYKKYNGKIVQYYHQFKDIIHNSSMKIIEKKEIKLFSDDFDKLICIFENI